MEQDGESVKQEKKVKPGVKQMKMMKKNEMVETEEEM